MTGRLSGLVQGLTRTAMDEDGCTKHSSSVQGHPSVLGLVSGMPYLKIDCHKTVAQSMLDFIHFKSVVSMGRTRSSIYTYML